MRRYKETADMYAAELKKIEVKMLITLTAGRRIMENPVFFKYR